MTEAALEHLRGLYLLQRLNIHKMRFTGDGLKYLMRLRDLVELSLFECRITEEALSHLPLLPVLSDLNLNSTDVPDAALRFLERLPRLQKLNIGRTQVTGSGLKFLEPLRRLRELELDQSGVTDEGLQHLPPLDSLEGIDLGGTAVGDDGLVHLQRVPRLTRLRLDRTRVTDAGMAHLARCRSLKRLSVDYAAITVAGVNTIKCSLPECALSAKESTATQPPDGALQLIERPIERTAAPVAKSWKRIEKWLTRYAPDIQASLRPPASKSALRQLEKSIGQSLPPDVRESYLIHDGQNDCVRENVSVPGIFFGIRPLPLREGEGVEWCWQNRIADDPLNSDENNPEVRDCFHSFPEGAVRLARMRPGWVPLYWDCGSSFLGIDLDPGPRGIVGQLIPFGWEFGTGEREKYVLAQSWAHFLEDVADELEAGHGGVLPPEMATNWFYLKGAENRHVWNAIPAWSKAKLPKRFQGQAESAG